MTSKRQLERKPKMLCSPHSAAAPGQAEKKCYDAAMAFTHSISDSDKKEIKEFLLKR